MANAATARTVIDGSTVRPIPAERLVTRCDIAGFSFATTAELPEIDLMMSQDRARAAIDFAAEVGAQGFNLFVAGTSPDGMDQAVKMLLEQRAKALPRPSDWVYVNNFAVPHLPIAIELPASRAAAFRDAMNELIGDLQVTVPAAFESEDYQARRTAIEQSFSRKQEEAFKQLQDRAAAKAIAVIRTPVGFTLAPIKDGQVLRPDMFAQLPEQERSNIQLAIEDLETQIETILRSMPAWDKERRIDTRKLDQETTRNAVEHLIEETKAGLSDLPRVVEHLGRVRGDLIENFGVLLAHQRSGEAGGDMPVGNPFGRYEVNLLVSQPERQGAPVVEELHPTLANLLGRVEHIARQGVLATDFRLIKSGALHQANGGFLLLDARAILTEPFAWAALKRSLKSREIRIENAVDLLSLTSTITLQSDPIPLNIKVVLFGERSLYYLLAAFDPEFRQYFKILADFDDTLDRKAATERDYAGFVATITRRKGLLPLDREAVGRVIEQASRLAEDAAKLTLTVERLGDLLVEAEFWARKDGTNVIGAAHVRRAIDEQVRRMSRVRDRVQETIVRGVALVDTAGSLVGQVNGLSVTEMGGFSFGRPSRITARVSPGSGRVLDIEREVELGGPIHSKGVLILSGFLSGRYALDAPISLFASLVFEQSYGGVEGDSASSAELYALLSALAEVPVRQDLAVTGSVNQYGIVQAIGGVNEKVEGFFDVCKTRGLTGTQGVLIPSANVQHLMLREDVVDACKAGQFSICAISTIDEGLSLLSGLHAGSRAADEILRWVPRIAEQLGEVLIRVPALNHHSMVDAPAREGLLILSRRLVFGTKSGSLESLLERKVPALIVGAPQPVDEPERGSRPAPA